jgi:hypothetical protein
MQKVDTMSGGALMEQGIRYEAQLHSRGLPCGLVALQARIYAGIYLEQLIGSSSIREDTERCAQVV